jgi:hypothetical protein
MPWFILVGIGILIGFCMSNATMRHHALTLIIWISKALKWGLAQLIALCEWTQDKFDDIEMVVPQPLPKSRKHSEAKQTAQPDKDTSFDWERAMKDEVYARKYVNDHPEQVHGVKHKGGE